jgi:hypothetical protein
VTAMTRTPATGTAPTAEPMPPYAGNPERDAESTAELSLRNGWTERRYGHRDQPDLIVYTRRRGPLVYVLVVRGAINAAAYRTNAADPLHPTPNACRITDTGPVTIISPRIRS